MLDVEICGISVVLVGHFNPMVFSPAWLRLHNLAGDEETKNAEVQVIAPPMATFSTDWLTLSATQQNFTLSTAIPEDFERLRELAIGVLTVLNDTPLAALGINLEIHWKPDSYERWHQFGDTLVPKDLWEPELLFPGMQSLTVRGIRKDDWAGQVNVTFQPSVRIPEGIFGSVNDHFALKHVQRQAASRGDFLEPEFKDQQTLEPKVENLELALTILRDDWQGSTERSEAILKRFVEMTRGPQ